MIAPVFFAPFVLMAPGQVSAPRIEAAAIQGLILGWVLQMAMGGIPTVLGRASPSDTGSRPDGLAPAGARNPRGRFLRPCEQRDWQGVALVNLGVAAIWVVTNSAPKCGVVIAIGYPWEMSRVNAPVPAWAATRT